MGTALSANTSLKLPMFLFWQKLIGSKKTFSKRNMSTKAPRARANGATAFIIKDTKCRYGKMMSKDKKL